MSGGKGGSQTSKVTIPKWLEDPSRRAITRGEDTARIGYMPYSGPDVAGFSPTQLAAFDNTNQAANAFGVAGSSGTGMPAPTDFNGVVGYSGYPILDKAVADWRASNPDQGNLYDSLFVNSSLGRTGQEQPQPQPVAGPSVGTGQPQPQPTNPQEFLGALVRGYGLDPTGKYGFGGKGGA